MVAGITLTAPNGATFAVMQELADVFALQHAAAESRAGLLVELGTWNAGGTYALRAACPMVPMVSYDRTLPQLTRAQQEALGQHTLLVEADVFADPRRLASLWEQRPWPVFLYCDDGDKPREVATFAPLLRPGDVIGCHDWGPEIGPAHVLDPLREFEPFATEATEGTLCRFWRRRP